MKPIHTLFIIIVIFISNENGANAQTVWTGSTTTFTKENNVDWTLEDNQDRITDNVWITRAINQGIFNIVTEDSYSDFLSPADTEWAIGTTADIGSLTFQNWEDTSESNPPSLVNQDMVVHLITDDIYIDIKFTSWQSGGAGGGFAYERSTDPSINTNQFELNNKFKLYPNPANEFIKISGLLTKVNYRIYDILGKEVKKGDITNQEQIDIQDFTKGLYFIKLDNGNTIKFMKE
ncbi:T9SS type A sorting domain-containing protein [Psychroflexus aestuariivivens]|uniref:T9SS type A sorting domain-containing protein n=1 Tax=Psychroflexus aestuariivivens TaxID=1795040 RepID=UPI001300352C|nr:T9SS type A sorting domain-containing protein [Psychroflexus aestuariivivens]